MSRFVSAGTAAEPPARDDEWLAAQRELDAKALEDKQKARAQAADSGKSLFEVLQANKAAKDEAYAESHKLKHQFRALDDDEAEFLDSVLESTRKQEAEVQRETQQQLELFRQQRAEAERQAREAEAEAVEGVAGTGNDNANGGGLDDAQWRASGRKRKKARDKDTVKGVKLRKLSSAEQEEKEQEQEQEREQAKQQEQEKKPQKGQEPPSTTSRPPTTSAEPDRPAPGRIASPASASPVAPALAGLLGAYSSDEE